MMPKKGFNLKSNDLMVVPIPIRKKINALKWERFCDARSLLNDELVREFYASLTTFIPISYSSTISMEQMLLLSTILTEKSINVGKIILKKIHDCAKKKAGSEQEEPTEPDTEESTDGTKTEANLVTDAEEEESDMESNIPKRRFPDAIFETWTEDTDDASGDGAEEDKGNKSKN
ncbi:hypothetical protein Gotur_013142, partial [Gossypium turneri]